MGCHFLPQGILPTQVSNPCLLHWQVDSLMVSHQGSPATGLLPRCKMKEINILLFHQTEEVTCRVAAAAKSLQSCPTLCDPIDSSPPGSCPWDSPGKNTGVGCHVFLQGIFPTQGSNLCLLHWQVDSLTLSHQGSSQAYFRF